MKLLAHLALGAAAAIAVSVTTLSSWSTSTQLDAFLGEMRDILAASSQSSRIMPQTVTATWISGGATISLTTPREAGQTVAQWAEAHRVAVDAMKVQFPPDE